MEAAIINLADISFDDSKSLPDVNTIDKILYSKEDTLTGMAKGVILPGRVNYDRRWSMFIVDLKSWIKKHNLWCFKQTSTEVTAIGYSDANNDKDSKRIAISANKLTLVDRTGDSSRVINPGPAFILNIVVGYTNGEKNMTFNKEFIIREISLNNPVGLRKATYRALDEALDDLLITTEN